MSEVERIIDQLTRAYDGDAWCGSSLRAALENVTAQQAAARPVKDAHSIWEIVMHTSAWLGAVRERIEGHYVREPAEGDWQVVTDASDEAWAATLANLERNHAELLRVVTEFTDDKLDTLLGTERDRATGAGVSVYVTLHGTAQHSLYHAAQIAILKKTASRNDEE